MDTRDYLRILQKEIHSAVFAVVDDNGFPTTRVIDIMLSDDNGLYFITARGKEFYRLLEEKNYVAISGMTSGGDSLSKKAISVKGKVRNVGQKLLNKVFEENPYMKEIYRDETSREVLEVFQLYQGEGEYFDLSTKPITRETFYIGHKHDSNIMKGYFITDKCHGCRICYSKCPQKCIDISKKPFMIEQNHCLHCGNCIEVCPFGAIEKR